MDKMNVENIMDFGGGRCNNINDDMHSVYEVCTLHRSNAVVDVSCAQASQFASHSD